MPAALARDILVAMPWWSRAARGGGGPASIDEFLPDGERRAATPLELGAGKGWESRLSALTRKAPEPRDLALPAFTLIRGGDLYEPPAKSARPKTDDALLDRYQEHALGFIAQGIAREERDAARAGVLRVLRGNPAICRRMLLAKPIDVVIVPAGQDLRAHGFPRHTHPHALGVFWNGPNDARARLGLREEHVLAKPYLMIHEMMHAVHFLGLTAAERSAIDAHLLPVFVYSNYVEEVVAIHAERAFGARYGEEELRAPEPYGRARREWSERSVFARFIDELLRPGS